MQTPGFFFCICPDAELIRSYVDSHLKTDESIVKVFWADEGLDQKFWSSLDFVSMDGRLQILVVRGAHVLPAAVWKTLSSSLAVPHAGAMPVLCLECPWEKNKPKLPAHIAKLKCLAFATEKRWIWNSPGLDKRSLRGYVQEEMRRRGLRADNDVLAYLSEIVLPEAAAVKTLLSQLELAAADGSVTWDIVRQNAACTPDAVIFDLIRHLEQGNAQKAWGMLKNSGDGGEELLFPLLSLMSREARTLWQLCAGEPAYVPGFLEAEKKQLARRLGFGGVADIFAAVAAAEQAVKSGERQPLPALEALLVTLLSLFQNQRTARQ